MPSAVLAFTTALALVAALAAPALAVAPTPELPLLIAGGEGVATTEGAAALLFNSAGLGLRYPSELLVAHSRLEPGGQVNHELLSLGPLGLGATQVKDGLQSYGLGLAGGGERLRLGVTTTVLVNSFTHRRTVDHDLGALSRPAPWLSLGARVEHLPQTALDGQRLRRIYDLGVGLRPLALSRPAAHTLGPRFTLGGDLQVPEDGEWSQARARFSAEVEPIEGVVFRATATDHRGFRIGMSLLGPRLSLHGQSGKTADGDRRVESGAVSLHRGEDRTALAGPGDRRVATLRVGGHLGDEALNGFALLYGPSGNTPVAPIRRQLDRALDDPLTRGVLLELTGVSNYAAIEELRPAIARLRAAGKPVVAYLEYGGGRGDLYLASACDRIVTTEEAFFAGLGLRVERRYYRRLLEDWGMRIDRTAYGKYKSAYRIYNADSTPPADREAIERNLDVRQELFVSAVAADRRMDRERLLTLLDGRVWPPRELKKAGLVDSVGYREEALAMLGRLAGLGEKPRTVNLARAPAARRDWTLPSRIAVVFVSGGLAAGSSGNDLLLGPTLGDRTLRRQLESAFRSPSVEAVVLRIESPGGDAIAANLIDHDLLRLKRETRKPLIVSMGEVAASGGYYAAVHADRIFADRNTVTGSIGVVSVKPSLQGWYAKHDVRQDEFERGRMMRAGSQGRDWDREVQAHADSSTLDYYRGFVSKVADGRSLSFDEVDEVAQGRAWLGDDARERKLVDEIGGLDAAIDEARRRARVPAGEKLRPLEFRRPRPGLAERLIGNAVRTAVDQFVRLPEPGAVYYWMDEEETP